ncbi:hypothetical protein TSUD_290280 [Trifolium subterraneum]|uniref:Uncharacterized protein n=1 Tax=Trifolium subterraneum TaxID=3900 RepID=A0A2Z6M6G4_TRISU|nr:hypothetical protein TSUD_290280 [Trifolium subterraneum]
MVLVVVMYVGIEVMESVETIVVGDVVLLKLVGIMVIMGIDLVVVGVQIVDIGIMKVGVV